MQAVGYASRKDCDVGCRCQCEGIGCRIDKATLKEGRSVFEEGDANALVCMCMRTVWTAHMYRSNSTINGTRQPVSLLYGVLQYICISAVSCAAGRLRMPDGLAPCSCSGCGARPNTCLIFLFLEGSQGTAPVRGVMERQSWTGEKAYRLDESTLFFKALSLISSLSRTGAVLLLLLLLFSRVNRTNAPRT